MVVSANAATHAGTDLVIGHVAVADDHVPVADAVVHVHLDEAVVVGSIVLAGVRSLCIGMYRRQVSSTLRHCNTKPCKRQDKFQPTLLPIPRKPQFRLLVRP